MDSNENKQKLGVKDWIIIGLGVIIIFLLIGCGIYSCKLRNAEKQVVIWNDSTYVYKNKYNEEYTAKNTYILEAEQLKKYNAELYKEYKSLKDNPVVITKTKVITKIDTFTTNTNNVVYGDSTITWGWEAYDDDYYSINGISVANLRNSDSIQTSVNNLEVDAKLTLNVVDNGEQLSVVAKTDNPYVYLENMQSVIIDPTTSPTLSNYYKPKRWGFSVYFGLGVNCGWDPIHNNVGLNIGPSAGVAVTYDIFQW